MTDTRMWWERPLDKDFYRCEMTGEQVYKWTDTRMVLVTSDEARSLRTIVPLPSDGVT